MMILRVCCFSWRSACVYVWLGACDAFSQEKSGMHLVREQRHVQFSKHKPPTIMNIAKRTQDKPTLNPKPSMEPKPRLSAPPPESQKRETLEASLKANDLGLRVLVLVLVHLLLPIWHGKGLQRTIACA